MKLPRLDDDNKKWDADKKLKLPEVDTLEINEHKEKFKKHFEIDPKEIENNDELKNAYENLVSMFSKKEKSCDLLLEAYKKQIKEMNLYNLKDFENAIETGELDLSKYDIYTMNKLFNKLEERNKLENLENYGIITIEDFYSYVTSGKIDVSKYEEEEIDSFLDKLISK